MRHYQSMQAINTVLSIYSSKSLSVTNSSDYLLLSSTTKLTTSQFLLDILIVWIYPCCFPYQLCGNNESSVSDFVTYYNTLFGDKTIPRLYSQEEYCEWSAWPNG